MGLNVARLGCLECMKVRHPKLVEIDVEAENDADSLEVWNLFFSVSPTEVAIMLLGGFNLCEILLSKLSEQNQTNLWLHLHEEKAIH